MIKAVLIDIDDTLLDFKRSSEEAIRLCFEHFSLDFNDNVIKTFHEINDELWRKIERKELTKQEMYGLRWVTVFHALGIECDGVEMEVLFRSTLSGIAEPVDYAYDLLEYLYKKYPLYAASNSSFAHQQKRMTQSDMLKYFKKMFVSETVGALKPAKEFFDFCFAEMGNPPPNEVVIIGDSLTSDISGGGSYGLKTIWFNPLDKELPSKLSPTFTVKDLREIKDIL
ncbi:MAG: YjjG family noncanonical pyrimidine nucleotidase [Clostridia bacterium]|nr:YjjG family noncanonical pyrimidine nucleotidase [Clostridia bacterium]